MVKQKRKTTPLFLETTGILRQRSAAHVMTFMGTRNQFMMFALLASGMCCDFRVEMDGK